MSQEGILGKIDLPIPRLTGDKTKVREMYDTSEFLKDTALMVTTDRISAFDVVMKSLIPGKGKVLNKISAFWFKRTGNICPNHFISDEFDSFPSDLVRILQPYKKELKGRVMFIRKVEEVIPIECIVRGYILGSAWKAYQESGEMCGIKLPEGLKKGDKLPDPIFTPSTKTEYGQHDENISFKKMSELVGKETARILRLYSLNLYVFISTSAAIKDIEIPDTKFEFGRLSNGQIIQIDETGTPDSSRYIPDYSKQPFRDWLTSIDYDKKTPIEIPPGIIQQVSSNYVKACEIITGHTVEI